MTGNEPTTPDSSTGDKRTNRENYLTLGLDPGDTTGVVVVDNAGHLIYYANVPHAIMPELFRRVWEEYGSKLVRIVAEDYRLFDHKAVQQRGSSMQASRIIGMAVQWGVMHDLPMFLQMSSIKPIAERWSHIRPVGPHALSHWVDAYNHVFYWLHLNGYVDNAYQQQLKEGQNVTGRRAGLEKVISTLPKERPQQPKRPRRRRSLSTDGDGPPAA